MPEIISLGELLVEIMRTERGVSFKREGLFAGPFPSGAPAIYINQAARLGAFAGFIGVCGKDDFGRLIVDCLEANRVDTHRIKFIEGWTTGCAFVTYASDGSRQFIFHLAHSAAGLLAEDDIDPGYFKDVKLLHIMGSSLFVSESSRDACYKAIELTKERGGLVSFDPNLRPELMPIDQINEICWPVKQAADIILPSGEEASMLTGIEDAGDACRELLSWAKIVGLKLGAQGSKVFTKDQEVEVASIEVEEVDPTGAGDCWDAGFTVGYLEGRSLEDCARFANIVGALSVTKLGPMAGAPSRAEVEKSMGLKPQTEEPKGQ
ncbi:MAG: sugar kinase [Candidatus Latescibacteria bacterium]|nr:sugar kinase [Candidatus Latescibacterota bacterium]